MKPGRALILFAIGLFLTIPSFFQDLERGDGNFQQTLLFAFFGLLGGFGLWRALK